VKPSGGSDRKVFKPKAPPSTHTKPSASGFSNSSFNSIPNSASSSSFPSFGNSTDNFGQSKITFGFAAPGPFSSAANDTSNGFKFPPKSESSNLFNFTQIASEQKANSSESKPVPTPFFGVDLDLNAKGKKNGNGSSKPFQSTSSGFGSASTSKNDSSSASFGHIDNFGGGFGYVNDRALLETSLQLIFQVSEFCLASNEVESERVGISDLLFLTQSKLITLGKQLDEMMSVSLPQEVLDFEMFYTEVGSFVVEAEPQSTRMTGSEDLSAIICKRNYAARQIDPKNISSYQRSLETRFAQLSVVVEELRGCMSAVALKVTRSRWIDDFSNSSVSQLKFESCSEHIPVIQAVLFEKLIGDRNEMVRNFFQKVNHKELPFELKEIRKLQSDGLPLQHNEQDFERKLRDFQEQVQIHQVLAEKYMHKAKQCWSCFDAKMSDLMQLFEGKVALHVSTLLAAAEAQMKKASEVITCAKKFEQLKDLYSSLQMEDISVEADIVALKSQLQLFEKKRIPVPEDKRLKLEDLLSNQANKSLKQQIRSVEMELWVMSLTLPEISIEFPNVSPLYGTAAQDLPIRDYNLDYSIKKQLAEGLFKACTTLGSTCVLKRYSLDVSRDQKKFRRNCDLMARLGQYPGVMAMNAVAFDSETQEVYAEMDFYSNGDLDQWIKQHPERTKVENGKILYHIGLALEVLHSNGIVHRDLKPQNILMDANKLPILTDFDLSRDEKSEDQSSFHSTATCIVGTQAYVDPAVLFGQAQLNYSSDLYSLGVIAGELIANTRISPLEPIASKVTEPEAKELLEGLLCPDRTRRWTLKQFLQSPFVKGIQRCMVCLENHLIDEMVRCSSEKDHASIHYMCCDSFQKLVSSFCGQEVNQLANSGVRLKCPEPTCLRYYSDVDIARYAPNQIKEYVAAKLRTEELKMSNKMKEELERLLKMNAEQREAQLTIKQIVDGILNLNCPRCGQVFVDFEGCFALTCSRCGCGFCAWCFKDCGKDAHRHVASCSSNLTPKRAVFGSMSAWRESNRARVKTQVQQKLDAITNTEVKKIVLKSLERELQEINVISK
jgi:hypothetical protein